MGGVENAWVVASNTTCLVERHASALHRQIAPRFDANAWRGRCAYVLRPARRLRRADISHMEVPMAEQNTGRAQTNQGGQSIARQEPQSPGAMQRQTGGWLAGPFELMDRIASEMDRSFDRMLGDFGMRPLLLGRSAQRSGIWAPRIEAMQKGDRFVVRAELPGLKKEDVQIDVAEDAITIRGERHDEREEQREGYFHSERQYGQFYRTVPLPEGAITETAEATFKDGVLEITMQAPPHEASRGRRLEIKESAPEQQRQKS
jgi:HSP20 family protein